MTIFREHIIYVPEMWQCILNGEKRFPVYRHLPESLGFPPYTNLSPGVSYFFSHLLNFPKYATPIQRISDKTIFFHGKGIAGRMLHNKCDEMMIHIFRHRHSWWHRVSLILDNIRFTLIFFSSSIQSTQCIHIYIAIACMTAAETKHKQTPK